MRNRGVSSPMPFLLIPRSLLRGGFIALKARQNLGQLLEEVYYRGDHYIIERAGKPMAAVVPVWQFEEWQQHREQFFAMIDAVHARNADVPSEVIEQEIAEAVQAVRQQATRHGA